MRFGNYFGGYSNSKTAEFVQNIFKTIRKYKGAAVAITQDVKDLFSLDDGKYGRGILTNSEIKIAFSLEKQNIKLLKEYIELSEKEEIEISNLDKGIAWLIAKKDRVILKVEASKAEHTVIIGGDVK